MKEKAINATEQWSFSVLKLFLFIACHSYQCLTYITFLFLIPCTVLLSSIQPEAETLDARTSEKS